MYGNGFRVTYGNKKQKYYILGIPFVDLTKLKISQELLYLIPEPIARKHNIVPFHRDEQNLEVAMLDPDDMIAIDFIKKGVGLKILPRLTDTASIKSALLQYQKSLKAEFGDIIKEEASKLGSTQDGGSGSRSSNLDNRWHKTRSV
jgi:type IV pilus assembly protein PilB